MNKAELASVLARENDIKKSDAVAYVDSLFDILQKTLASGDKVAISGFGSLETVTTKARTGRNPQTGAPVSIPAKKKVKWVTSGALKKALNS